MQKYTPADTDRSIAQLQDAVRQDPSYARAHAALAGAYIMRAMPFGVGMAVAEQHRLMALAKAAGERALQLDETLAVAHAMLASASLLQEWDWRRAREALDRAIRLEPSSSSAHALRAMAGACLMEREVTRREAERAVELDPLNLGQRAQVAETLYWVRDYEGAIRGAVETLAFDPAFPRAHFVLGRVYEAQGRIPEAIDHYRKAGLLTAHQAKAARSAFRRGGTLGFHRWALQVGFGAQGGPATGTGAPLRPLLKAKLHCQAGNLDEAIAYLEQAYAEHEGLLILMHVDIFDPLHGDPRFEDLVRRVGLPSVLPAHDADLPA
jgi:tetratricopeptide (TPR) repeat protein